MLGSASQQALADALTRAAPQLGLGHLMISARQILDGGELLRHLGLEPTTRSSWSTCSISRLSKLASTPPGKFSRQRAQSGSGGRALASKTGAERGGASYADYRGMIQPPTAISDYAAITAAYRRLYASVQPAHLHAAVVEHTRMGAHLLTYRTGISCQILPRRSPKRCC